MAALSALPMTDAQIAAALDDLGISPGHLAQVGRGKTYGERKAYLEDLHRIVKANFRAAALRLHPDRTGNDPEQTERYLRAQEVAQTILSMKPISTLPDPSLVMGNLTLNITVRVAPSGRVL